MKAQFCLVPRNSDQYKRNIAVSDAASFAYERLNLPYVPMRIGGVSVPEIGDVHVQAFADRPLHRVSLGDASLAASRQDAMQQRVADQFSSAPDVRLLVNALPICLYGRRADSESLGCFFVGVTRG